MMFNSNKPLRMRAMATAGGIAVLGVTGVGMSAGANAATTSGSAASTLAKIKYCESGGNYQAVNSSSGASGAYQFLNSTWRGLSAASGYSTAASAPASVQDAAALELYNQAGTSPWASSSGCWSSLSSVPTNSSTTTTGSTTSAAATTSTTSRTAAQGTAAHHPKGHAPRGGLHPAAPKDAHAKPGQPKPQPKAVGSVKPQGKHHAKPTAPNGHPAATGKSAPSPMPSA